MEIRKSENVGLFLVGYEISTENLGSSKCHLRLTVDTPKEEVTGTAHIYNVTVNPPLSIHSMLKESPYTYMCTMKDCHILITCQGMGPIGTTITPLEGVNFKLRMVLDQNWESGTARYSFYSVNTGKWNDVEGKVKKISL